MPNAGFVPVIHIRARAEPVLRNALIPQHRKIPPLIPLAVPGFLPNLIPDPDCGFTMPAMDTDEPQAGDDDGQTHPAAPEAEQNRAPSRADDELRRLAAEQLAQHLEMGASLVERCETLAQASRGDRLGPLNAAARLMHANAHVAQTLAHVALVERRSRSIIERIQPPDPKIAELNSNLQDEEETARARLKFYRRMNEHIEQSIRARTGESEERDSVADLIRGTEETIARIERERTKLNAGQS